MGQRHQAYLIARVKAHGATQATYRCVGAVHHQWCFGRLPPRAARCFIDLATQKENSEVIREELRAIDGMYGSNTDKDPEMPNAPLPFTLYLLACAFHANLEGSEVPIYTTMYHFDFSLLDSRMNPSEGDNNDGITCFDITDPTNVAYCHASVHGLESNSWEYGDFVPVNAQEYAASYGNPFGEGELVLEVLNRAPLIPLAALAEAWPKDFQLPNKDPAADDNAGQAPGNALPSLADLTLRPAVDQAITGGDFDFIEQLLWIPEKSQAIMALIREHPSLLQPKAVELLKLAVAAHPSNIDLSGFSLTSDQLVEVLSIVKESEIMEYLNLSHNIHVDLDTLRRVVAGHPKIHRLVLYGTSITVEQVDSLTQEQPQLLSSIQELIHPARFPLAPRESYHSAFSFYVSPERTYYEPINSVSIPFLNLPMILQNLVDYFGIQIMSARGELQADFGQREIAIMACFGSAAREEGKRWGQRSILCVPIPSRNLLKEGWLFACSLASPKGGCYGFLRPRSASEGYEIHDFDSFIKILEVGYPFDIPSASVEKVRSQIKELNVAMSTSPPFPIDRERGNLAEADAPQAFHLLTESELSAVGLAPLSSN